MTKKKLSSGRLAAKVVEPVDAESIEEIRQLAIQEVFESPQPSTEVIAEILNRIESLPVASTSRLLLSLAQEGGEKALPLLERLAQSQNSLLALAAIEALGGVRSPHAVELLARVADTDPNRELRKDAKRALFRLRSLGVAMEAPLARPEEVKGKYPIFRSILSSFDGTGTRAVLLGVQRPLGGADQIVLLLNAESGLTHCAGIDTSRKALIEKMDLLIKEPDHGMLWADVPVSYCQQLVKETLALNPKSGTPVPRGYYRWKDEIGQPAERHDRPLVYRELSPLEVKWDPTLLEQSGELLDRHEFDSWVLEPAEVTKYYLEMEQMQRSSIALPGWSQKERQEAVMKRCFEEVMTAGEQARYKFELEEMAYLFLRHDRRLDARRALAVAVAMDELRDGELVKIPFMRDLLERSFASIERERQGEERLRPERLGIITPDQFLRY